MQRREEVKRIAVVIVTGDRGLAGPFNGQVLRRAFELEREARANGQEVLWLVTGRKGASTLRFRRYEITGEWAGFADKPAYADAQAVAHRLTELYVAEEVDRVVLVYNRFISALVQRVTTSDLLPIPEDVLQSGEEEESDERQRAFRGDFIYEPEPEEILQRLLPVYLETEIYRSLLESAAAFLASQMTAMRNASKNAGELLDRLTLAMNRARQAEITQEILEVVAGADALAG
jgi:F-type H+-transporting ATPase subunit gamma